MIVDSTTPGRRLRLRLVLRRLARAGVVSSCDPRSHMGSESATTGGAAPPSGLWGEAFRVERSGIDVPAGLAGAVASCAPLAIGIAVGEPAIGVVACFGGLNAALGVPRGPLRERLSWGIATALACCASVAIATLVQPSVVASAVAAFLVVAIATSLRTFGHDGGLTGFVIGAIFTITNGIPAGSLGVGERTLWFFLGSLLGVVLMVAVYGREAPPRGAAPPLGPALAAAVGQLRTTFASDRLLRHHALRLATIVAATTVLYRATGLEHGYWVPLTVLAVLQPDEHASRVRALQRAAGTLVGTVVIAVLTIATGNEWLMVAAQGLAAFGLFSLFARGYFWLVVMLTPTALLTVSAVDYQGAGIALGLVIGELVWRLAPHLSPHLPPGAQPPARSASR
jgi:hypothetical protein